MPVERTRSLKRSDSAGNQFVWASNEPTTGSAMSFTPHMSSFSFSDSPPPLVDAPSEFIMFPPPKETASPRRQPHSKKKPDNHIPRPPNAFILFRSSFIKSQHVSTEVETNHSTLSKIIGLTWQNLPEEERQIWHMKAKEALDEHKLKFPKYAFKPVQTKAKGPPIEKRKVREVEPKDMKRCTKIAQLLVEGKKGDELNVAIQEFDKHHVPEIVTRFEAPITARAYRRSSSAPIPDTESSRASHSFLQKVVSKSPKKFRAASTRPTRCSTPIDTFDNTEDFYPTVDVHPLPLKQEPSFNFSPFSFNNIASPQPTYDCDPLSPQQIDSYDQVMYSPSPSLSINTSFLSDWSSSPSPDSPQTPGYSMSPNSMSNDSPLPPFDVNFDAFDQVLDFSPSFHSYDQTCGMQYQQENMCGGGGVDAMYAAFNGHSEYEHLQLSQLDPELSAFMGGALPVSQYAM